jgi:HPt (histidine-containing phosphotransfer) domain-containing protein
MLTIPPDPPDLSCCASEFIDTADGLDRVMGDHALYQRMLARFRRDYADGARPMHVALAHADRALAHRLVHTLKGSAGMIGAYRLHDYATQAEVALRTGSGDARAALVELDAYLLEVLAALDSLLAKPIVPRVAPRHLLAPSDLMARLAQLLHSADGAAVDLVEECGPSLEAILGTDLCQQLIAAVSDFNYPAALRLLAPGSAMGKLAG